jgi:hypothetical protein
MYAYLDRVQFKAENPFTVINAEEDLPGFRAFLWLSSEVTEVWVALEELVTVVIVSQVRL